MTDQPALTIRHVTRLDLSCDDWRWPFAEQRRNDISAYFARLCDAIPQLWNGRVLLARDARFDTASFAARYFETDFASFLAWRDWGFPDRTVINGFGMGALRGSDGGFVLGEMAAHSANAGRVYFPSGTPDPADRRADRLDMAGSVAREVLEETGYAQDDYVSSPTWHCIVAGSRVSMIRILNIAVPAASIRDRIIEHIAQESDPELSGVHIVRRAADITPAMPDFIAAFFYAQLGSDPVRASGGLLGGSGGRSCGE